jgi:hypothetical protein
MKSILDPSFRYTASLDTDLRRTFARILSAHWKEAQSVLVAPVETLADDALDNVVSQRVEKLNPVAEPLGN